jgi:hypothetical protein
MEYHKFVSIMIGGFGGARRERVASYGFVKINEN